MAGGLGADGTPDDLGPADVDGDHLAAALRP